MEGIGLIGIVGTGLIGAGMATLMGGNGIRTLLVGRTEEGCGRGIAAVTANYNELAAAGVIGQDRVAPCLSFIEATTQYDGLNECPIVFECVQERLALKHAVYSRLEQVCADDTVIVSMTSSILPDDLCAGMKHPERLLVAHPWNPPHLVPCVEVVRGSATDDRATALTVRFLDSLGKRVVVLRKNIPGFIGNRIQHAMFREALHMIEAGVATPEEIDETVRYSFGPRYGSIGLMEYYDSVGLDLQFDVQSYLLPTLSRADAPQQPLLDRLKAGDLGPKSGRGFYDWHGRDMGEFARRKNRPFYQFVQWRLPEAPADEGE